MPKPQASCTMTVADGMVVRTQLSSPVAEKAQQGMMELLLINHPLDCPICDKGGECPLQNQAMSTGRTECRFVDEKRTYPKPLAISTRSCWTASAACCASAAPGSPSRSPATRSSSCSSAGALQQIGVAQDKPFQSYFSGNTIQICPVGALTSAAYRFRSRPFDLVSTPSVCEHCACGCAMRTDTRRGVVLRRLAGKDPEVNEEWICDKGRFAFRYLTSAGRITPPMVRGSDGVLQPRRRGPRRSGWPPRACSRLVTGGVGVLAGGRLTVEDAYAYAKFARLAVGTNDIDSRARPHCAEELDFLAAHVVGTGPERLTYTRLEAAPAVLCVALEPEEESPVVFLRLRKAAQKRRQKVFDLGQWTTPAVLRTAVELGSTEPAARDGLIRAVPGAEAAVLTELADVAPHVVEALTGGGVILVGERAAEVPGLFTAAARLAERTGAVIGWVPRRAGERGAVEAGALPTLLPGGRPVADDAARAEVEQGWGLPSGTLPATPGRSTAEILAAAAAGELDGPGRRRGRPARPPGPGRGPGGAGATSASWSAWSCTPPRSRSSRTSCSRWRRTRRRPAATWTGRAAAPGSTPRWTPAACCPTAGCSTRWPWRWTSTSVRPDPGGRGERAGAARPARRRRASPARRLDARRAAAAGVLRPGGAGDVAPAARRVGRWRSTSPHWPARPGRRSCAATPPRPSAWAWRPAHRGRCAPSAARSRCRW